MEKIKVLIVDDSKLVREILGEILSEYPLIEVVGKAEDAFVAREMIKLHKPDVLTLDVEMPKMDGLTFLKNLMRLRPMAVIMLSTLTTKGADTTLQALELGAVDFIAKPRSSDLLGSLSAFNNALYNKIKFAASVNIKRLMNGTGGRGIVSLTSGLVFRHEVIALGASTGGTDALRVALESMPKDAPPVILTQHIPPSFSLRFAKRLNNACEMEVQEARDGQQLLRGNVYVARGDMHLVVVERSGQYFIQLDDGPPVNLHKPSVDVMFDSLTKLKQVKVFAAILTGMGGDGAKSLLALKEAGHYTLVQDEATSMIWGMPGVAFKLNAHCEVKPLNQITKSLLRQVEK